MKASLVAYNVRRLYKKSKLKIIKHEYIKDHIFIRKFKSIYSLITIKLATMDEKFS
jgi:hypothetical protein